MATVTGNEKEKAGKKISAEIKDEMQVFIPKDPAPNGDNTLFVSVNGKHYTIMKGIAVTVPTAVGEVIEASLRQAEIAEAFCLGTAK